MDDRPIKFNALGKYNLNFVDPTNDLCVTHQQGSQLFNLINEYFDQITYQSESDYIPSGKVEQVNIEKLSSQISSISQQCLICLQKFIKGCKLKQLPCKHCFHQHCIQPWFSHNTKCPNCRFDLQQYFKNT